MTNPETQVESYFAKYEPATASLGKALRAKLQGRLPGLSEVVYVYERQKSLVISYSPSGKGYDAPCTLAVYPGEVKLYLAPGPQLAKADPNKLLQGSASKVRYVVLNSVEDFERAEIQALVDAALNLGKVRLDPKTKGAVIIKAEDQKKRAAKAR